VGRSVNAASRPLWTKELEAMRAELIMWTEKLRTAGSPATFLAFAARTADILSPRATIDDDPSGTNGWG
jgi:hypothetical protein